MAGISNRSIALWEKSEVARCDIETGFVQLPNRRI